MSSQVLESLEQVLLEIEVLEANENVLRMKRVRSGQLTPTEEAELNFYNTRRTRLEQERDRWFEVFEKFPFATDGFVYYICPPED